MLEVQHQTVPRTQVDPEAPQKSENVGLKPQKRARNHIVPRTPDERESRSPELEFRMRTRRGTEFSSKGPEKSVLSALRMVLVTVVLVTFGLFAATLISKGAIVSSIPKLLGWLGL